MLIKIWKNKKEEIKWFTYLTKILLEERKQEKYEKPMKKTDKHMKKEINLMSYLRIYEFWKSGGSILFYEESKTAEELPDFYCEIIEEKNKKKNN